MGVGSRSVCACVMFIYACVCVCLRACWINCRLGGATHCLPCLWSRGEPLEEWWRWWHVVPVTSRLAPRPVSAAAAAGAVGACRSATGPTERHAGAKFILGGGLVPDTLSALPPTFIYHHPPSSQTTHTHLITTQALEHGISNNCWTGIGSAKSACLFMQWVVVIFVQVSEMFVPRTFTIFRDLKGNTFSQTLLYTTNTHTQSADVFIRVTFHWIVPVKLMTSCVHSEVWKHPTSSAFSVCVWVSAHAKRQ